ncbi:hypothetical protein M011DRAFT_93243 [Sporormia fimetaria CBS 119925]|uniref:Zn(2)-C6 fungal-type domain-containing protein n=1 Tax=Sporormia fimetaria CBS 119925 TaxID=1340428 RepID=A0A6A6VAN5_9PLEO|nr:hypothetical protein M011DRAFT_93243 [Sporormia fimetaria CBS 119925]
MSGYYHPNQHGLPQYYHVGPNGLPITTFSSAPPLMAPDGSVPYDIHGGPLYHGGPYPQYSEPEYQSSYAHPYEDAAGAAQGGHVRSRRRSGVDNVKHRRTRSGCFTCRQRRVKCDEQHPVCERCRKGNRECVYPDPQTGLKPGRKDSKSSSKSPTDGSSPEKDEDDEDAPGRLPAIKDEDEGDAESDYGTTVKREPRDTSGTPSLTLDRSPSPPTETSSTAARPGSRPALSRKPSMQTAKAILPHGKATPALPKDVRFYLESFKTDMSHHHYALKHDSKGFFKHEFLALAMKHEPLRYAMVGYTAYFHTLTKPDGQIPHFLQYYNESVSRLRASITKNRKQGLSTFLTILQLASIEEVLGDWVNLLGHQKAAYEILTRLYTPESITKTELLRKVLLWYSRFDLFVGFQSGGESVLSREWYVTIHNWYAKKAKESPENLDLKYEERFANSRLVAKDSNELFAKKAKGVITDESFMEELPKLTERMKDLEDSIDPALLDPSYFVKDLPGEPDPADDIVNPYEAGVIWGGSRWTSNYLLMDTYGILFMFHLQVSMALRRPPPPDLTKKALRVAQVFEAICKYPKSPPGAILEAQATLAIATLFLPKDPRTVQWCRRTFARIESSGYIYSNTMRNRMLEQWGLEHSDWWLPNDEDCPRIIRSIKDFIQERTTAPKDQTSEDLREMKGIFSTLTISDSPPDEHMEIAPIEGVLASGTAPPPRHDETIVYTGSSPGF